MAYSEDQSSYHDRKIFVGGVGGETNSDDLQQHFSSFGEVKNVTIKYDQTTGRSRGFAFVEFATKDAAMEALNGRHQEIKGKKVEVKRVTQRENKKIFVGGVSAFLAEDDIRQYFSQFGEIEEVQLPIDQNSGKRRNFCFVIYSNDEGAEKAAASQKHFVGDRYCDVKKATPFKPGQMGGNDGGGYQGGGQGGGYWGGNGGGPQGHPQDAGGYGAAYQVPEYGTPAYYQYYQAWYNYYYGGGAGGAGAPGGAPQAQPGGYGPPQAQQPQQGYGGGSGWGGGQQRGGGGGYGQNGYNSNPSWNR